MAARSGDPEARRTAILDAARLQFGRHGFDRTTIRSVAAEAGVDPALVMHYFGNKKGLFEAAAPLRITMPDLSEVPPDQIASMLVPLFVKLWGPDGPLLPLLRAAASNPNAAETLVGIFNRSVPGALDPVATDRTAERAALIGSQLLGIAVARHIVGLPGLAEMDDETLAGWLGPVFAHYLTGEPA